MLCRDCESEIKIYYYTVYTQCLLVHQPGISGFGRWIKSKGRAHCPLERMLSDRPGDD